MYSYVKYLRHIWFNIQYKSIKKRIRRLNKKTFRYNKYSPYFYTQIINTIPIFTQNYVAYIFYRANSHSISNVQIYYTRFYIVNLK